MDKKPCIWSYVVTHDGGTAPCVDNNLLSLCICKPVIRRGAVIGDWIIGFARKEVGENLIVYIAEVTEKILMEEYFIDPEVRQDKIYNFVDNEFIHYGGPIHNSPKNWKTDISGIHCLISKNFWYFGEEPLPIPEELNKFYYPFIGEKKFMELQKLKNYMQNIKKGVYAKPFDK